MSIRSFLDNKENEDPDNDRKPAVKPIRLEPLSSIFECEKFTDIPNTSQVKCGWCNAAYTKNATRFLHHVTGTSDSCKKHNCSKCPMVGSIPKEKKKQYADLYNRRQSGKDVRANIKKRTAEEVEFSQLSAKRFPSMRSPTEFAYCSSSYSPSELTSPKMSSSNVRHSYPPGTKPNTKEKNGCNLQLMGQC